MKLTPRQLFRKQQAEASTKLAVALSESWLQQAISAALADLAFSNRAADLAGANAFIETLHQLADDEKPDKDLPDKSGLPSYGM